MELWEQIDENTLYIFIYRHPLAVINSLLNRGTDQTINRNPVIALRSWIAYNSKILNFLLHNNRSYILFHLDTFLNYPEKIIEMINWKSTVQMVSKPIESVFYKNELKSNNNIKKRAIKTIFRYPFVYYKALSIYGKLKKYSSIH